MKVTYFGYYLTDIESENRERFDLRDLTEQFCQFTNSAFKNNFIVNDEHVYVLHVVQDVYMLVMTRDSELIRSVNTNDISVQEIADKLDENEHIGFASYFILKESHFGFASTLMAPKVDVLNQFYNNLLVSLGITNWKLKIHNLTHSATREEAVSMPILGKTVIELSKTNGLAADFLRTCGVSTEESIDLEGIEIILKPKLRKNIKPTVTKVLESVSGEGVEKLIVKAKNEMSGQLTDLYLLGNGAITDTISNITDSTIASAMEDKLLRNTLLAEKITEFTDYDNISQNSIDVIVRYHNASAWTALLSNIQTVSTV
ncbi:hypothetical protein [Vibrio cortegadensis]|uniref:hypothetical protein n=1 Tax=Vibrio cortegadensis TaxID=1328770 RepID=UPI00352C0E01